MNGIIQMNELLAEKVGVNQAIVLAKFYSFTYKGIMERESKDEKVWVKVSTAHLSQMMTYFTRRQLCLILSKLEDEDYIESTINNEDAFDKTKSYCLTEKAIDGLTRIKGGF